MFTVNTCAKGGRKPLQDWFIIVNGQQCQCNKSITIKISKIIHDFYENEKNKNFIFATEIRENSESTLNSICQMISKLFCGEEIICQEDNFDILYLIGKHFRIQEIINTIEDYQKYMKIISFHLKESIDFNEMIELEKMLLYEINETNIETKVTEYESLIKKIPISCFFHFVINICTKNLNLIKIDTNEFVFEIIKKVNKIIPDTLPHFLSILCHKFIFNSSELINKFIKTNQKEIDLLIHQMFVDGLVNKLKENIIFNQNEVIIPEDLQKYFKGKGNFFELIKENNSTNNRKEAKDHFFSLIESIKNDNIDSFLNHIVDSQIDINCAIKTNITDQLSFIINGRKCYLIELSALLGSIKCFTYLYNKQAKFIKTLLSDFAVAGGNTEIIHICEREDCVFNDQSLDISIEHHRYKVTKWLIDTKNITFNEMNLRNCIIYYNIRTIRYLMKKGINISKMMIFICESNNIILLKWLGVLRKYYEMKMIYQKNGMTLFHIACEQNNVETVKLLISNDNIDINEKAEVIYLKNKGINYVIKSILLCY